MVKNGLFPYKNTTHDICHHVFMYDGRDKNTNSQTNDSIKYILNTYRGVIKMKFIATR